MEKFDDFVKKLIEKYSDKSIDMSLSINDKKCTFRINIMDIIKLHELHNINAIEEVQDTILFGFMKLLEKNK